MARVAEVMERQPTDRRRSPEARCDRGRDIPPQGDVWMEQILANMNATPRDDVWKEIASLPRTRQDKVLDIRRQLTEGTYEVAGRLDIAIDRVLEAWFP